jgi:FAD/FMN-containing dehydrogenase
VIDVLMPLSSDVFSCFLKAASALLDQNGVLTAAEDKRPYTSDWRGRYHGHTRAVLRPASTEQCAALLALCSEYRIPVVPQGGNTGLCGGSVPRDTEDEVVLSLSRMNRIRAIDIDNDTVTVEAGCILANVQQAAARVDRLFPLNLAAEGSCQIGGNISTNAGGTAVLRYGNMRELVLGLEVVLPDGRVWNGLRTLRKDNTGYDLKQLFIGAEGTLGVITAAVLKLFPSPRASITALAALPSPSAALVLLNNLRNQCGFRLSGFELISRVCLDLVFRNIPGATDPFPARSPWYALVDISDSLSASNLDEVLERSLAKCAEEGVVLDAVVAASKAQAAALWSLRENISEAQRVQGTSIKHDISVPVSSIPAFLEKACQALEEVFPEIQIVAFGHMGDGNIHFNVFSREALSSSRIIAAAERINRIVYELVDSLGGSISAEHGIGQLKRMEIRRYKSSLELELMGAIKRAIDPNGIMNPGKVL